MRYLALATDYDGTLSVGSIVTDDAWEAVRRLRDSGRKLLLVTGRTLDDLRTICPHLERFDRDIGDHPGLEYRLQRVGVTKRRHVAVEITPEQDDEGKAENRDLGF